MKSEKACGAVIIKEGKTLLIEQLRGDWSFPKGHVEDNETEKETAIREVKEETNIDINIISDKRYVTTYTLPNGVSKTVVFFLAEPISNVLIKQECEIKDIEYYNFDEAKELITHNNIRKIFSQVLEDIEILSK